jgi:hypothetical protein
MTRNVSGASLTIFEPRTVEVFAWFSQRGATLRREQRDQPRHRYRACLAAQRASVRIGYGASLSSSKGGIQ